MDQEGDPPSATLAPWSQTSSPQACETQTRAVHVTQPGCVATGPARPEAPPCAPVSPSSWAEGESGWASDCPSHRALSIEATLWGVQSNYVAHAVAFVDRPRVTFSCHLPSPRWKQKCNFLKWDLHALLFRLLSCCAVSEGGRPLEPPSEMGGSVFPRECLT